MCLTPQTYDPVTHLHYMAKMTVKHAMELMEMSFEYTGDMSENSYLSLTAFLKDHYDGSVMTRDCCSNIRDALADGVVSSEWIDERLDNQYSALEWMNKLYMSLEYLTPLSLPDEIVAPL